MEQKMKVAAIQMLCCQGENADKKSIEKALVKIREVKENGANLVVLPEMFCCPYKISNFPIYAQKAGGENWQKMSKAARDNGVYLVAGTMPESDGGKIYNTAFVFDRNGNQIARYRKMHLFNCDFKKKGGMVFHESDTLSAGNEVVTFDTEFGKIGIAICFDIRFPELSRLLLQEGANLIIVPAAFNMTSGPLWWELSFRMRAVDNQNFYVACSPARDEKASYVAWGHSLATDPFGNVLAELDEKEGILYCDIDFSLIPDMREQTPVLKELRHDVYKTVKV